MRQRPKGSWKISKTTNALVLIDESMLLDERKEMGRFYSCLYVEVAPVVARAAGFV